MFFGLIANYIIEIKVSIKVTEDNLFNSDFKTRKINVMSQLTASFK